MFIYWIAGHTKIMGAFLKAQYVQAKITVENAPERCLGSKQNASSSLEDWPLL